ncbi:Integrin alpha-4-like protein, partial [Dinothrombium tinctorium]
MSKHTLLCAPRWTNIDSHRRVNPSGLCYLTYNKQQIRLSPFQNPNYQRENKKCYYSHAMSGFSTAIYRESVVAFGAPGFYNFRGAVVVYLNNDYENTLIFYAKKSEEDSYMGYSVGIGKFFSDKRIYIAAGAPRCQDTGCVGLKYLGLVLKLLHLTVHALRQPLMLNGEQFGEYYGASLVAIDINHDGYSDLIVGAPFYSPSMNEYGDCGRIFVYMSNGERLEHSQTISLLTNIGARFGSSITSVGDVNFDNFEDIAIGAPYEDGGQGAIYLYLGQPSGLSKHFVQKYLEDKVTPLEMSLSSNLSHLNKENEFCKHCAILLDQPSSSKQLDFLTGCGSDKLCVAHLEMNVTTDVSEVVEGLNKEIELSVLIKNEGENAYLTKLKIKVVPAINLVKLDVKCKSDHLNDDLEIN